MSDTKTKSSNQGSNQGDGEQDSVEEQVNKKLYERLDKALKELDKRSNVSGADELAERTRKLANMLAGAAAHEVVDIRRRQTTGVKIDHKELTAPSLALEKVTKAVEAYSKYQQVRVDMQSRLVAAEIERVKAQQKDGSGNKELKNKIYRHQLGKPTATPVLKLLNSNKRKPVAEMTEEEKKAQFADENPEFDEVSRDVVEDTEVPEAVRSELEEGNEGR